MISTIMGSGSVTVSGGQSAVPYVSINYDEKNPVMGMVRVNGSMLEAFNGTSWIAFTQSFVTVNLTGTAESALSWAMRQQEKERERERLIRDNPALQNAWDAIKRAEDNFDILSKFVEHDNNNKDAEMRSP